MASRTTAEHHPATGHEPWVRDCEWRRRGPKWLALWHDDDCAEVVDVDYVADNLTYRIEHASQEALR